VLLPVVVVENHDVVVLVAVALVVLEVRLVVVAVMLVAAALVVVEEVGVAVGEVVGVVRMHSLNSPVAYACTAAFSWSAIALHVSRSGPAK
jgi:hypothetical protein